MKLCLVVLCCIGVNIAFASTYKAAVADAKSGSNELLSFVYEAGKKNVDVVVIPSEATDSEDYDENVKKLSKAAKQAGLYLIAHLKEKTRCQNKQELVRSNLVFDREGAVIAVYRKPQNIIASCNITAPGHVTFETDFGVTFGVMMVEDLALKELNGLRNYVVSGSWSSAVPYFSGTQFFATWSYTNNANLISATGVYAGRAGAKTGPGNLVAELKKNCHENITVPPVIDAATIHKSPGEDLSQYIIRPLDVVAGAVGYKKTVCHNSFCCEFDLKTRSKSQEVSYGLAAFNGVRHLEGNQYIGAQNCAVFACAGLYKRSCSFGSINNNTNIAFEKLSISANFTNGDTVYPVILSNERLLDEQFKFSTKTDRNVKTVQMSVTDGLSLLTFGMFGRVLDRDYVSYTAKDNSEDFYDYIFTEDVQEFFDYLWIRVRILLFVVSIYILEML